MCGRFTGPLSNGVVIFAVFLSRGRDVYLSPWPDFCTCGLFVSPLPRLIVFCGFGQEVSFTIRRWVREVRIIVCLVAVLKSNVYNMTVPAEGWRCAVLFPLMVTPFLNDIK